MSLNRFASHSYVDDGNKRRICFDRCASLSEGIECIRWRQRDSMTNSENKKKRLKRFCAPNSIAYDICIGWTTVDRITWFQHSKINAIQLKRILITQKWWGIEVKKFRMLHLQLIIVFMHLSFFASLFFLLHLSLFFFDKWNDFFRLITTHVFTPFPCRNIPIEIWW